MKPPKLEKDSVTWFMALAAMRYCIGRRSYAPVLCAHWIMRHWPIMPSQTRSMLRRDLSKEIGRNDSGGLVRKPLGDDCDEKTWRALLDWMLAQPPEDYAQ